MGGKSTVAAEVWKRFGRVVNYVEPFAGSLAVLLGRPQPFRGSESVNDLNAWITNLWRALAADPDAVAAAADWPVSELCTHSRGDAIFYRDDWYQRRGHESVKAWVEWLRADPGHYDALVAGWWVWGQSCWIGDNWGRAENKSRKDADGNPCGVVKALPHLGDAGQGVNRQLPHLGTAGKGVNRKLHDLAAYFRALADRLRRVRVCCGDWSRVMGPSVTWKHGLTGVFLDPPYSVADRDTVYGAEDSRTVAHDVAAWCRANGDNPLMRIALCGYVGEHDLPGWTVFRWKTAGGYASQNNRGNDNGAREIIHFSPHCLDRSPDMFGHGDFAPEPRQPDLLEAAHE
jgi:hypothetical protein